LSYNFIPWVKKKFLEYVKEGLDAYMCPIHLNVDLRINNMILITKWKYDSWDDSSQDWAHRFNKSNSSWNDSPHDEVD